MTKQTQDSDSPWKEILEQYFPGFIEFFFPAIFSQIDWEMDYEFLDKELQKIVRDSRTGRRIVDKLIKVWLKNGSEIWVLIHVEIQGRVDPVFAKRMYTYNYRLFDRYDRKIVSLAVLTDDREAWKPDRYGNELWGCEVGIRFPVIKLTEYREKWDMLESSRNPFAIAVMAHLKNMETKKEPENRLLWKLSLVKRLYQQGFRREDILELFRFIDWIMMLPEELEKRFADDIHQYEEDNQMPYVTSVERIGIQKGLLQGMQQGLLFNSRESVIEILEARFDAAPKSVVNTIKKIDDISIKTTVDELSQTPCRTRLLRVISLHLAPFSSLSPAPLRTVLALFMHTAPYQYIHFVVNRFTVIRGFGRGYLSRSFTNFSQDMQPLFPRRFNHLKSNFLTS